MVTPEVGIAIGGNGIGARWSYEVGRIAARMITKARWDHDLPAHKFRVNFRNQTSKLWWDDMEQGPHIDMVYVYVPAFWGVIFAKFG